MEKQQKKVLAMAAIGGMIIGWQYSEIKYLRAQGEKRKVEFRRYYHRALDLMDHSQMHHLKMLVEQDKAFEKIVGDI